MIAAQNPDITDDQIAFSIGELKKHGSLILAIRSRSGLVR
jgi:hypothetical protein